MLVDFFIEHVLADHHDVTKDAEHLVDARAFVQPLQHVWDELVDVGGHRRPGNALVFVLQQMMQSTGCV